MTVAEMAQAQPLRLKMVEVKASPTDDARLAALGGQKGIMQLIERERSEYLMAVQADDHGPGRARSRLVPGGSG